MSTQEDIVVGIDLGTTNSSVGYVVGGRPVLIDIEGSPLLPSVVGFAPDGTLLVGRAARNQRHLYPERTVTSVKRQMGREVRLPLGETEHTPVEVSAMILRRLKVAAEAHLGRPVPRAVITVPAFFSDAQRTATREAGEIAGFKVERILNEPTAAALCYVEQDGAPRTLLVYDLGGGTFDVSVVRTRGDVTEVLASHGDTALGGDDFDALLRTELLHRLSDADVPGVEADPRARARLFRAAEEAKIRLSEVTYVPVVEEHLIHHAGVPVHLKTEVDRRRYEDLIEPLLERTRDSVQVALREAKVLAREIDEVVLVGGSTRTPRVAELLHELLGKAPRQDVDPDQAVALGAAIQAARLSGQHTSRILVDVSPYSFGTSHFGELDGWPSEHCYTVILRRNHPLPARQSQIFYTMTPGQEKVEVNVFQGEDHDARRNLPLGEFMVEGLDKDAASGSPILFELSLDLDGILHVEVTEKHTGLRKKVVIEDAFRTLSPEEVAAARERVAAAMGPGEDRLMDALADALADDEGTSGGVEALPEPPENLDAPGRAAWATAISLLEKVGRLRPKLERVDAEEVDGLSAALRAALAGGDLAATRKQAEALADALFYLE